jgi:fluoroacetyl-CoA thioesterase
MYCVKRAPLHDICHSADRRPFREDVTVERSGERGLVPGIEATQEFTVEGRLVTDVGGTIGFSVLSTPGMIGMMERTAAMLVYPLLPEGQATVGFEVCVRHVAGAALTEVLDGRKLRFAVDVVHEDGRTIGVGTHERRVIQARPG